MDGGIIGEFYLRIMVKMSDRILDFIYKWRPLYNKKPISENDLKNKSLDELILMKESERDFLSINIPIVIGILWIMFSINDVIWKVCMLVVLVIFSVNIWVAHEEKKKNIETYNKVILEKTEEKNMKEEKYRKEIASYLKEICDGIKK